MTAPGERESGGEAALNPHRRKHLSALAGWASAYAVMAGVGGLTRDGTSEIALVWPASGIAFLWILHATVNGSPHRGVRRRYHRANRGTGPHLRPTWPAYLALACVAALLNGLTGAPWGLAVALGLVNSLQAGVSTAVFLQVRGARRARLEDSRDLNALLIAALAGAVSAAPLAGLAVHVVSGVGLASAAAQWVTRNAVSVVVVAAVGLVDFRSRPRGLSRVLLAEWAAFLLATGLLLTWVFGTETGRPFAFMVLLITAWSGLRLGLRITTFHLVVCAVTAILLTMKHSGPFADVESAPIRSSAVQAFVGLVAVIGLGLAMSRRTRRALDRANERSALLGEVSRVVSASLDLDRVLARFGELVVPRLGDHCVIDLLDDAATLRRETLVHATGRQGDPDAWSAPGQVPAYAPDHPAVRSLTTRRGILLASRPCAREPGPREDPVVHVDHPDVASVLAVPLLARGQAIGVLSLLSYGRGRLHGEDDLALVAQLADRAATAIDNARMYRRQCETSRALQRSLMPTDLPETPGLDVAASYVAASRDSEVGGDWYDVLPMPTGRVAVIVGDVMGRGIAAAALMGQVRAALRAYAGQDLPPAQALTYADELIRGLAEDTIVTCVYGVYDPREGQLVLANAGHVPPLLMTHGPGETGAPRSAGRPSSRVPRARTSTESRPAGTSEPPPPATRIDANGPPLGAGGVEPYGYVTLDLPVDRTLALYTDGLVESRGEDIEVGIERLVRELRRADGNLEHVCASLLSRIGPTGADDAALLLLRPQRSTCPRAATRVVAPDRHDVGECRRFTVSTLAAWGESTEVTQAAELLVSELVTNSVRYARPPVSLSLSAPDDGIVLEVRDHGGSSPRLRTAAPDDEGGRGLMLVAALASRWGTRTLPDGGKAVWCHLNRSCPELL